MHTFVKRLTNAGKVELFLYVCILVQCQISNVLLGHTCNYHRSIGYHRRIAGITNGSDVACALMISMVVGRRCMRTDDLRM